MQIHYIKLQESFTHKLDIKWESNFNELMIKSKYNTPLPAAHEYLDLDN